MKKIAILGSTGSIGTQTLDVIRAHPDLFRVTVLAAGQNDEAMAEQIEEFKPELAVLADEAAYKRLSERCGGETKLMGGRTAFIEAATYPEADLIVTSMVGFAGLEPTIKAIRAKKNIALANKETLVVAGELVVAEAEKAGVNIIPVDSEHSALWQCLRGEDRGKIEKLILTCSGGPFRGQKAETLTKVTRSQVLAHPTWNMGAKITVDSATLVNKGFEVIEAKWLYGVGYDQIQVVVHPQSIVHSMVEFVDGMVMAQLGAADMRLPIQYALTYPDRQNSPFGRLNFWEMRDLTFAPPDTETFRGLGLAYAAGRAGGTMPTLMNAANEVAVAAFLRDRIGFLKIYEIIERVMDKGENVFEPDLATLLETDRWARKYAESLIGVS